MHDVDLFIAYGRRENGRITGEHYSSPKLLETKQNAVIYKAFLRALEVSSRVRRFVGGRNLLTCSPSSPPLTILLIKLSNLDHLHPRHRPFLWAQAVLGCANPPTTTPPPFPLHHALPPPTTILTADHSIMDISHSPYLPARPAHSTGPKFLGLRLLLPVVPARRFPLQR
jgi:hypothetical protein